MSLGESRTSSRGEPRSRSREGARTPADQNEQQDFDTLLEGLRSDVMGHIDTTVKQAAEALTKNFTTVAKALDSKNEKRFSTVENSIADVEARQTALTDELEVTKGVVRKLQQTLDAQEQAVPIRDPINTSSRPFDGPIDVTILKLETKEMATKIEVQKLVDALFKTANIENDKYKITGDELDNRFILRFSGAAGLAATRVNLARKTLRDESGKWLELSVETPSGSKTRAFINPDKNPKMVKTERDTKRLGGILKDSYPNIKWHLNTYDGEISKVWTPMVKVEAQPGDTESILRWNLAALAETDIDKREVVGKFSQSARNRAQVQWGL